MTADDVKRILVVGAGQMGAQIAMQSALHGYQLTLNDLSMDLLQKGMAGNRKQLERRVQKGQMTKDQMAEAIARVRIQPGSGQWLINGRPLDEYFPNKVHQQLISEPFVTLGAEDQFDVIARITGGGDTAI